MINNNNNIYKAIDDEIDDIYSGIEDKFIEDELSVYLKEIRVVRAIRIIILLAYLFIYIFISYIY
jgi:hypothetical protein